MFVYFLYKLYIFSNLFAKCSSQITQFFWWKKHVTKSFVWTFTRTNVYVVKKNVHLFIWNTNTVYFKKNQMAYGMHLNLFCKSLACLCFKCLHIVICWLSTGASSHVKFFCSTPLFVYVKRGGSESFSSQEFLVRSLRSYMLYGADHMLSGADQNLLTLGKWNWRECRFFERLWMLILLTYHTLYR